MNYNGDFAVSVPVVVWIGVSCSSPCQVCYARVLDFRRKFIEAAQRYNELSYKSIVHETERLEALKHALNCTILASAGTLRLLCLQQYFERHYKRTKQSGKN